MAEGEALTLHETAFPEILDRRKRAFLTAYAECGNKKEAARIAGIDKSTPYTAQWLHDDVFQAALERARVMACDVLEQEAHRRAVEGIDEYVGWYKGVAGGTVRRYSDTLLIFLMKGHMPHRYKERVQVSGTLANIDLSKLPDSALSRIANGEHPWAVIASLVKAQDGYIGEVIEGIEVPSDLPGETDDDSDDE